MKFKTYLPVFSGFYNTIWQPDTSNYEYSEGLTSDEYEFDNSAYEKEVAEDLCRALAEMFPTLFKSIIFEKVWSPKEYNFKNDHIDCTVQVNVCTVKGLIYNHPALFAGYIRENFTSGPGFTSFYSNEAEDWLAKMKRFRDLNSTEIGTLLEFTCRQMWEEMDERDKGDSLEMDLYYDIEASADSYCTPTPRDESDRRRRYRSLHEFRQHLGYYLDLITEKDIHWGEVLDAWFECVGRLYVNGCRIPEEYKYEPAKRIEGTLHKDSDYHQPLKSTDNAILYRIAEFLTRYLQLLARHGYKPIETEA